MGWDTTLSKIEYRELITKVLEKVKELFNEVEGSYFLFWVEDSHKKRVGCSFTGHYLKLLRDPSVNRGITNYFAKWCPVSFGEEKIYPSVVEFCNPWLIDFKAEHIITLVPEALERSTWQLTRTRKGRWETILKIVHDLCQHCDIPFIMLYNFGHHKHPTSPYACPSNATEELFNSEFFKKLIDPTNVEDIQRLDWLPRAKKARVNRPLAGQLRQNRSSVELDIFNESPGDDPGLRVNPAAGRKRQDRTEV